MAMGDSHLAAVSVIIDLRKSVQKAPEAGSYEMEDGHPRRESENQSAFNFLATVADIAPGVQNHEEDRQGLQRAEDAADPQPVLGRAQPVVMVAGAGDPGKEEESQLDVEPFLHGLARHAGDLDEDQAVNAAAISSQAPSTQR